jgi:uncharacterized phage protein gp47/JayE
MALVLARVWAGAVYLLYGFLAWIAKQLFPTTSDREKLLEQASMYDITPTAATFATGGVVATGTNGTLIPTGTVLKYDEGVTFETTADGTITGGAVTLAVEAVLAGSAGNVPGGEAVSFESPIGGVNATATVDAPGITGGFDEQGMEDVRDRLLLRLREPPQGGADQDYEAWTLAVAGVTRAWVYPNENGLGTVVVRFVLDGEVNIFPGGGVVADVQAALEAQRPITAEVTAAAPTALPVPFTIELDPDTAGIRDAVEAELNDLLFRKAIPGDGAGLGTILLSQIQTAIGNAVGEGDYTLTVPAADVVPATGQLAVLGVITWV